MSVIDASIPGLPRNESRDRARMAGIVMYALLLVSYVLNAMDRQLFAVLAIEVRKALGLSLQEVGLSILPRESSNLFILLTPRWARASS